MQVALLIEVDYASGQRAGAIDPRDENLQCYGWQSLSHEEGADVEIRLVEDQRGVGQFESVEGVTVLRGKEAINEAIREHVPERYEITNELLVYQYLRDEDRDVSILQEPSREDRKALYEEGAPGLVKREPNLL